MSDKPNNIDPAEWARYNASQARTLAVLVGTLDADFELTQYEVVVRELPQDMLEPARDLMIAVGNAASELEGQGEKSDRIAAQLYEAVAVFAKATGL